MKEKLASRTSQQGVVRLQIGRKVQPTLIGMRPQRSCGWADTGTCSVGCSTGAYLALQCSRGVGF